MDRDNVGRDEYPVKTTSSLDILIGTESGIWGNHQYSTYENCMVRGGLQHKERIGNTFIQQKGVTEDNTTWVLVNDRTNFECYVLKILQPSSTHIKLL